MTREDPTTNELLLAFGLTLGAGLATTLGAFSACVAQLRNKAVLAIGLSLAAGVMLYVSFVEILALKAMDAFEAEVGEKYAQLCAAASFFGGMALCAGLDMLVHKLGHDHNHHVIEHAIDFGQDDSDDAAEAPEAGGVRELASAANARDEALEMGVTAEDAESSRAHLAMRVADDSPASTTEQSPVPSRSNARERELSPEDQELKRMGAVTAAAILIHNFPEGLATFVATIDDPSVGIAIAVAIGLHNIPEGVCVAMPIYYATGNRREAFLWALLSGVAEPIGAVVGYFLLRSIFTDLTFGVLFGLVSGVMVFISVKELLPTARRYDPKDHYVTKSTIAGMVIMAASLVLFQV